MTLRIGSFLVVGLLMAAAASAQTHPLRGPEGNDATVEPDQPVRPQMPALIQRPAQPPVAQQPAQPQPAKPPFTLTPEEEAQVDRVLKQWEERNREIQTFDCRFKRWIYDVVFGPPNQAKSVEIGVLKYKAPNCGLFRIDSTETDGKASPIDNSRAEHWIADGKSIFEYSPAKKQVIERKLPKELQGKAIADSPLPFLFGAEAAKLKQRYFIRLITPANVQDQIWLESYPRYQQDAANFHHAQFIITTQKMEPYGLKIIQPNEKDYTTYQFFEIVINDKLRFFRGDPFRPFTPLGWQKVIDEAPAAQASRVRSDGPR